MQNSLLLSLPSRIDRVQFRGRSFYVKRDDLIHPCLSGNKYRKLYTLLQTSSDIYDTVISYGGVQSNAMLAIACLCRLKGWTFHYYTKTLPGYLENRREGNLEQALEQGMQLHEVEYAAFQQKIEELKTFQQKRTLLISQGGADEIAKAGIEELAKEINAWRKDEKIENLNVVLPSGTGTTALYLQGALEKEIRLYTSVLVGDDTYQLQQWQRLSKGPYPKILPRDKKRKFAKPYSEYLQMHQELEKQTGITFDLIYAPKTWIELLDYFDEDAPILYIHTGGVSGNETMRQRYRHKESRRG
ncbi:MAG: 1-aminocyclopropane-1-carboxylate deaminase [Campylobacterales bacterium]|nr:1-aminocyclopropane-1-carboxylate deaminase [Campylobacterales bacterium]